jgi:hypothetical protein
MALVRGGAAAHAQLAADTAGLGGRFGSMQMLLEKTFLKVDVLALDIRVDAGAAAEIEAAIREAGRPANAADAIANAVLAADDVWAELAFKRDIGVDRLVDEIRKSMRKAVEAGVLDEPGFQQIAASLPEWYAPLRERGIRSGDAQYYRIRGDTLHTTFVGREGATFIDQTANTRTNRLAVLGSWFATASEFRDKLIKSLPTASRQ